MNKKKSFLHKKKINKFKKKMFQLQMHKALLTNIFPTSTKRLMPKLNKRYLQGKATNRETFIESLITPTIKINKHTKQTDLNTVNITIIIIKVKAN